MNGERSVKLTNAPLTAYIVTQVTDFDLTKSYIAKLTVLTSVSIRMDVLIYEGATKIETLRSSVLSGSSESQTIQVSVPSSVFTENTDTIEIRLGKTEADGIVYMDNWELLTQ